MMLWYILVSRMPVGVGDPMTAMKWHVGHKDDCRVAETLIDETRVSTVFLQLDHKFEGSVPMLFETMVFGGPMTGCITRCSTWMQAEAMHERVCFEVTQAQKNLQRVVNNSMKVRVE